MYTYLGAYLGVLLSISGCSASVLATSKPSSGSTSSYVNSLYSTVDETNLTISATIFWATGRGRLKLSGNSGDGERRRMPGAMVDEVDMF